MSISMTTSRVSNTLLAQLAVRNINQNTTRILDLQYQMASGLRIYKPSVDPAGAAVAMSFQGILERRAQTTNNVQRSSEYLTATDSALADLQDLLNQALPIASAGVSDTSEARSNSATVVSSLIDQLTQLGNRQYDGRYLFGGQSSDAAPFDLSNTMVRFVGDNKALETDIGSGSAVAYNVTASEAFGTGSGQVSSNADLNPDLSLQTRLVDLHNGTGVRKGSIILKDGTNTTTLDVSNCDTVGDVINAINNNGVVGMTASLNAAGTGLQLQGGALATLAVEDLPGGFAAQDLGIRQATALPAGVTVVGADLDRLMTLTTGVAALRGGLGIDQTHDLKLTIGSQTKDIDLSGAVTVEDVLNAINFSGLDVRASINADGRGLTVTNLVSSEEMKIGEDGGSTASNLGLRTMTGQTLLSSLNDGAGLGRLATAGSADFQMKTRSGVTLDVSMNGLNTVQDVITAINNAPGNAGKVTAVLNTVGNGIRLQDNTAGAGNFQVVGANTSNAAAALGIEKTVVNPAQVITGDDVAPVVEQGVFHHLFALRDALLQNDVAGINKAGDALTDEIARVARIRGTVGSRMQLLEVTKTRTEDEVLQVKGLLSDVRDLDYADAVSRFKTMQAALQASLQTSGSTLPMSLLDFINL